VNRVKQHFEEEAGRFDELVSRLIPGYGDMIDALVAAIPGGGKDAIRVIDLGSGTGTVALNVLKRFPRARVTCVDFARSMIEVSKKRLSAYAGVLFAVDNFQKLDFGNGFDAVVSSLALHHLPADRDKREFYRKIFDALVPGGCFWNADLVLASGDRMQRVYTESWKAFMKKSVPQAEIENVWMKKYADEDRPAVLMDQCRWLAEIGFAEVDVVWKYYNFAVYGGFKS
jgi:tRNA (cmo5U34)-methyltransferase